MQQIFPVMIQPHSLHTNLHHSAVLLPPFVQLTLAPDAILFPPFRKLMTNIVIFFLFWESVIKSLFLSLDEFRFVLMLEYVEFFVEAFENSVVRLDNLVVTGKIMLHAKETTFVDEYF